MDCSEQDSALEHEFKWCNSKVWNLNHSNVEGKVLHTQENESILEVAQGLSVWCHWWVELSFIGLHHTAFHSVAAYKNQVVVIELKQCWCRERQIKQRSSEESPNSDQNIGGHSELSPLQRQGGKGAFHGNGVRHTRHPCEGKGPWLVPHESSNFREMTNLEIKAKQVNFSGNKSLA